MARQIPGGRGVKFGRDADVMARESFDERATRFPSRDGWALSTFPHLVADANTITFTIDRLVLIPAVLTSKEYRLYEVRICVDVPQAGSTIRAAIYLYKERTGDLLKVPYTEAVFSGATAGQISEVLDEEVHLTDDRQYFIGTNSSNAALGVLGKVAANGAIAAPLYYPASSTSSQPKIVPIDRLTKASTIGAPMVTYLSQEAAEMI